MNYSHWHLDQTQGEHWAHHKTTLLVMFVQYSKEADGNSLGKDALFCSDDGKHPNSFRQLHIEKKMLRK